MEPYASHIDKCQCTWGLYNNP